jgi:large subunit ribosomal protein L21
MYAIIAIGSHQYKVAEHDVIFVNRQTGTEKDASLTLDNVVLVNDGKGKVHIGTPTVTGATVEVKVLEHLKADKVIVFKKKRRKGYQKSNGHRQALTQLKIEKISI